MIFGFPLSISAFIRNINNGDLAPVNHSKWRAREGVSWTFFQVFGSKLRQINTTYLFHMQNA